MRYSILWLLLFFLSAAQAQKPDVVVVKHATAITNLAFSSQFLEDSSGSLAINSILHADTALSFSPVEKQVINFGISPAFFWIKTLIRNETGKDLYIKVGNNSLSDLDVFETIDGKLIKHFQSGGWLPFNRRAVRDVDFLFPLQVKTGDLTTVYIRVRHNRGTQFPLMVGTMTSFYNEAGQRNVLQGIYYGFMLLMLLYNLFIYFSLNDSSYLYYVAYVLLMGLFNAAVTGYAFHFIWPSWPVLNQYEDIISALVCMAGILFTIKFLNTKKNVPLFHYLLLGLFAVYVLIIGIVASGNFLLGTIAVETVSLVLVLTFFVTAYAVLRKGYKPAKFFLIAWSFLLLSVVVFVLKDFNILPYNAFTENALQIGSAVEALLLSMALANRINVLKMEKRVAQIETFRSLEENRRLIAEQNMVLEKKVEERTGELRLANEELMAVLENLRNTQAQLVQKEKMASLGELVAGIAHEIQNPLNFVNNFSEANAELLEDLKDEIKADNKQEAAFLADEAIRNEQRIMHHGKRADAIVKAMLEHSGSNADEKELTDLNALAEKYLRMTYHGLMGKDKDFRANLVTDFDGNVGEVEVASQELGRVLLNLYNNAFYAVREKKKKMDGCYEPTIEVRTGKVNNRVTITIKDNGTGIARNVLDKIYQPFFTTKPTGEGTGLGLSLSYDIVTKGHNGELHVETKEHEGTEFKIILPAKSN